jgi:hypothetical protein
MQRLVRLLGFNLDGLDGMHHSHNYSSGTVELEIQHEGTCVVNQIWQSMVRYN